tara:strand:+ start:19 stop:741 length:723 start_codon:yes stop_codon:yes gene_type:complete
MAGHSKWSNIKHRKGAQDLKRSKIFTKLIKEITIAAKIGGGDIDSNPRLRKAVNDSKASNMPNDKIDRAIKKGIGVLEGVSYEEVVYEGYGPNGVAIIIEVITDNKNRTVAELRYIFSKFGGSLGESGSVSWMFEKKGQITILDNALGFDSLFDISFSAGAEDINEIEKGFVITTHFESINEVKKLLEGKGCTISSAECKMIPKVIQKVQRAESEASLNLISELKNNDDVNKIYSNLEVE